MRNSVCIPPAGFSNDVEGLSMDSTLKLTKACFLTGCNDSFRPKSTLHKFCSKECKKEWEKRLYTESKVVSRILLVDKKIYLFI